MAFRGEDIDFSIEGTDDANLAASEFSVLVYPDGRYNEAIEIRKSDMIMVADNIYVGTILSDRSRTMTLGSHTIELFMIIGGTTRSIFAKRGALYIYDSASKDR